MYYPFQCFLSPAKLNLGLKIVGRRADGYHLLSSVFCLIDLCDKIEIQITSNGKISLIEHNQAWYYQKDLAYRAAKLLQDYSGTSYGVNLRIRKVIPSGAGMGGGSSNAATVLIILNQLWQLNLPLTTLVELGQQLGADVPFFIYGQNAWVRGIGEDISAITLPELYFVIVKPDFHIPTRDIFTELNYKPTASPQNFITPQWLIEERINDLEPAVRRLYPEINQTFDSLAEYGKVAMTGSGSCLYLTFNDKNYAKKVANNLSSSYNTFLAARLPKSPVACN